MMDLETLLKPRLRAAKRAVRACPAGPARTKALAALRPRLRGGHLLPDARGLRSAADGLPEPAGRAVLDAADAVEAAVRANVQLLAASYVVAAPAVETGTDRGGGLGAAATAFFDACAEDMAADGLVRLAVALRDAALRVPASGLSRLSLPGRVLFRKVPDRVLGQLSAFAGGTGRAWTPAGPVPRARVPRTGRTRGTGSGGRHPA